MGVSRRRCCWQAFILGAGDDGPRVCPCGSIRGFRPRTPYMAPFSHYEYSHIGLEKVLMKKPVRDAQSSGKQLPISDQRFRESYPTIVEYLTTLKYDDGSSRVPSALSLFIDDGVLKAALNDKDCKRSLYASGDTLEDVLDALEAALSSAEPAWRTWQAAKKK